MKAIILAAGMGTRLGDYTKDLPKCMLNFYGKTLIERQIGTLRSCGINDIIIVKGYMSEKINIPNVKYYSNKNFMGTNMVDSLFCAEEEMDDDILVCYADIIYEKKVIEKIITSNVNMGVTVDKDYINYWKARFNNYKENIESLVIDDEEKIIELGDTKCTLNKAQVRYVGLIKFSKKGVEILKKVYHKNKEKYFDKNEPWLRSKSFKKAYMTCILQAIINEGFRVDPIIICRGWLEFDTNEDYENYNKWLKEGNINRFINIEDCGKESI